MNWILKSTGEELIEAPEGAVGFVYEITNTSNMKKYIGRKQFFNKRKRKLTKKELSTDKRKRTWEYVYSENWKEYTGSNKQLNEDIKEHEPLLKKEILKICYSKKELTYWETFYLFKCDVLRNNSYYNSNIQSKFFTKDLN